MMPEQQLSRRGLLGAVGASLVLTRVDGMQTQSLHSLEALLDGSGMARIPAGEFLMGADGDMDDAKPAHRVRITQAFEMGKCEVSQAQWKTVMTDPHAKPDAKRSTPEGDAVGTDPSHFKGASTPVESVSWGDIQVFLRRLNARDSTQKYRLPSEAEWEYACKSGKAGGDFANLDREAWYKPNAEGHTQTVGQKVPNAWGLYDMFGNVSEWVQDWYSPNYYSQSPAANPTGPDSGSYRVYRGGCWFDAEKYCRPALRRFDFPISRVYNVGFRVVRTPR